MVADPSGPRAPAADRALDALWDRVLAAWTEERTHAAALEHAMRTRRLAELAARYRAMVDDPARGDAARRRLDAIVVAATSLLLSTKSPRRPRIPISITLSAVGICALLLAWLAWVAWGHP